MRVARFGLFAGLIVLLFAAFGALIIWTNQARLVRMVLARVEARSGAEIVPADSAIALGTHLVVTMDRPRLIVAGRELGQATRARLLVSYHALIFSRGLPLFSLSLDSPRLRLPIGPRGGFLTFAPALPLLARVDRNVADAVEQAYGAVSGFTRRVEIVDGTLVDEAGSPSIDDLNLSALRRHRIALPWRLTFSARAVGPSGKHFNLGADVGVFPRGARGDLIARGWFGVWEFPFDARVRQIGLKGVLRASVVGALHADGRVSGRLSLDSPEVVLLGSARTRRATLKNYSLQTSFEVSTDGVRLTDAALWRGSEPIAAGECVLDRPYEANPSLTLRLATREIDLPDLLSTVSSDLLPEALADQIGLLGSARIAIDQFSLTASFNDLFDPTVSLLERIELDARLGGLGFPLPSNLGLPPVSDGSAKIVYANKRLSVLQGTARFGQSIISDLDARVDLSDHFEPALYQLDAGGELDLGSLYPALARLAPGAGVILDKVRKIDGWAEVDVNAKGKIEQLRPAMPDDYDLKLTPRRIEVSPTAGRESITLIDGSVVVTPGLAEFNDIRVALGRGEATVRGGLRLVAHDLYPHRLSVRLTRVPSEGWLPLLIDPQQIAVRGLVDGSVELDETFSKSSPYGIKGKLTVGPGQFEFGFLRAPLVTRSAEADFDGAGLILNLPGATIEGSTIDFALSVKDVARPVLRIDAVAQKLDLEAMKFVRLPWSTTAPTNFFGKTAAEGHVEIRQGNLSKLKLTGLGADFERNADGWRVYNLKASALGGRIVMQFSGRAKDDWLGIKGRASGVDAGGLFRLSGGSHPPLTGKFYSDFDIWGDTRLDFFETLAGKASIVVKDGSLHKFTLLSRVLGLIDLKNWLTAQVPDPRTSGVPFRFITADFAGSNGLFYTRNLVLDGPVLDITAQGSVDVAKDSVDMELGLLPFQTVDWLINKVPLIGKEISQGSAGILAAYFRVRGPMGDPKVSPEPFTSAAEMVKKTLGLPLNILRPNTVK